MVLPAIASLLSQTIGLDPDVVGDYRIARAVENRRVGCQLPDLESYWARLQTSAIELEALIELLIVPETWFFRDGKPFDYLKTYAITAWQQKPSRKPLQLLSVPSSTGEEPYSMAIALLEAGLHPHQFAIDAIDISHRSLTKAMHGIYTKNSFRGDAWMSRQGYFQQTTEGYELHQSIRSLVNFQQGNVMTALTRTQTPYDIIFCRNLLIYLQSDACSKVLEAIDHRLLPGGLLFVGASETGKIVADHYISVHQPFTFAYRKAERSPLPSPLHETPLKQASAPSVLPQRSVKPPTSVERVTVEPAAAPDTQAIQASVSSASTRSSPESPPSLALEPIRKLADDGRLAEATTACQTYLEQHPTSAAAYVLLGELYQADQRHEQAEPCFQRALYLEPNSYDALVHLALLKESQGDTVRATLIQQRLQRLQHSPNTHSPNTEGDP
jgi:chemotaxis protein methyltransferase WspC